MKSLVNDFGVLMMLFLIIVVGSFVGSVIAIFVLEALNSLITAYRWVKT
jgi:hypothetical protein